MKDKVPGVVIGPKFRIFQKPFFIFKTEENPKGIFNFVNYVSPTLNGVGYYNIDYERDELVLGEDIKKVDCPKSIKVRYSIYPNDVIIGLREFAREYNALYFSYHFYRGGGLGRIIESFPLRRGGIIRVRPRLFVNIYDLGVEIPETFELGIDPRFLD